MYSTLPCSRLLVGISGSVHAAQIGEYLVRLRREFATEIWVIMTATATDMVPRRLVELAADGRVLTDIWGNREMPSPHIRLTSWAELFLVLPATANALGKAACGIADDLLSTSVLASPHPVVFAPAMNEAMWRTRSVQRNVAVLREDGHYVIEPASGVSVATGDVDAGLGPTPDTVMPHLWHVQMRRLRQGFWAEATAQAPRTPAAAKALPLIPVEQLNADRPSGLESGETVPG